MRPGKRNRWKICAAATALCILPGLLQITSLARTEIEETVSRITFQVAAEGDYNKPQGEPESGGWGELAEGDIEVALYKVADIDQYGSYTALPGFQGLGLEDPDYKTADEAWWKETAGEAAAILGFPGPESEGDGGRPSLPPDAAVTVSGGTGTAEVENGLYLVWAEPFLTREYRYTFLPYLVSLPHNDYALTGIDRWEHDVTAGLKPGQERRYGDLLVTKRLQDYEPALGGAVFVFEVEARKDLDRDGEEEIVYSNVLSLNFDAAGEKTARAGHIPAGAKVTVREVYSGGSYEVSGDGIQEVEIVATDRQEWEDGSEAGEQPAKVHFTNHYNGGAIPGTGAVNHFTAGDGGWVWEKLPESRMAEGGGED